MSKHVHRYLTDQAYRVKWGGPLGLTQEQIDRLSGMASSSEAKGLGDQIEVALNTIGLTKERVEGWVGAPCGCKERQQKLNALGSWAKRVIGGKIDRAREYLDQILT